MSRNSAVSSVVGTVLLLALVVAAAAIVSFVIISNIGEDAVNGPIVSFEESANPYILYHAGGDTLINSTLVISWGDLDITDRTEVNSNPDWTTWSTGEYLNVSGITWTEAGTTLFCKISEITIVYKASNGREFLLYTGVNRTSSEAALPAAHTISIGDHQNGVLTTSVSRAMAGDTVSVTATANAGYQLTLKSRIP